jgi:hypothetical protein
MKSVSSRGPARLSRTALSGRTEQRRQAVKTSQGT